MYKREVCVWTNRNEDGNGTEEKIAGFLDGYDYAEIPKVVKYDIKQLTYEPDINLYSFIKNNYTTYSYGFVAQNVAQTHPELVSYNESYLSVDYNSTLSLLLAKALNRIDALEKRVDELENKLKNNQ